MNSGSSVMPLPIETVDEELVGTIGVGFVTLGAVRPLDCERV